MSDIPPEEIFQSFSYFREPEILIESLCHLPVTSLVRLRAVPKAWCSLLDSRYFIKKHIIHSIKTDTNLNLVFASGNRLFTASFDHLDIIKPLFNPVLSIQYRVLGSYNGILCLISMINPYDTVFLNPTTISLKIVPLPPIRKTGGVDFGYDSLNDDYKVVRLNQVYRESEVWVYGLNSSSWRWVGNLPHPLLYPSSWGAFACGCLHWLVCKNLEMNTEKVIFAFDLGTETYRFLPLPKYSIVNNLLKMKLGAVSGYISLLTQYRYAVDVWILETYAVEESWYKLFSIPTAEKAFKSVRLLKYCENSRENLLEVDYKKLFLCDTQKKIVKKVFHSMQTPFMSDIYLGSLVQLCRSTGSDEKKKTIKVKSSSESFIVQVGKSADILSNGKLPTLHSVYRPELKI